MTSANNKLSSTHAAYHRFLQPAYEQMILHHVYKNKINLKSGASGQLLHKRPKTTGYLVKKREGSSYPADSTYWNPSANDNWHWRSSTASVPPDAGYLQDAPRTPSHPQLTDEFNLKASSRANTFSATTRVREVPVAGIYKREIQEFRSRTPSGRGVRASAITCRSLVTLQSAKAFSTGSPSIYGQGTSSQTGGEQPSRLHREHEQLQLTRERKRQAQVTSHRIDRMYYMHGSSSKIHQKYTITDDELSRLKALAISRGMKIPVSVGAFSSKRGSSISGPHSTPRGEEDKDDDYDLDRQGSAKTVIPTADTLSVGGDPVSGDETEKEEIVNSKEDRSTSDHEDDKQPQVDEKEQDDGNPPHSESVDGEKTPDCEVHSIKSDSAVLKQTTQRNVTFLTDADHEEDDVNAT